MNAHLRQTGRTERMIANALSLNARGRAVYIFTDSQRGVARLREILRPEHNAIKVEVIPQHFDWEWMRPQGSNPHPNYVFLVEHQVIERELGKLDEEILRLQQLSRQLYHLTT